MAISMDKPHICFFSHSSLLGGAERSLLDMMISLSSFGIKCSVVMAGDGAYKDACEEKGIDVKTVSHMPWWCDTENNINKVYNDFLMSIFDYLDEIVDTVKELSPDIIFTQTIVNPIGAMVAEKLHLPHFWALREYGELDHDLIFALGYRDSMDMMFKTSNHIFSVTKSVAQTVLDKYNNSKKITVNYSSISVPEKYINNDINILQNEVVNIGIFGSVVEGKNQKDIIKACLILLEKKYQIRLHIVGNKNLEYFDELNSIIDDGYQDSFIWEENQLDPYPLMYKMDIIVSCARSEALGRTLFEAVLLKKPIIYSNVAGSKEVFISGEHGLGYELYNSIDLSKKIIDTIENKNATYNRVQQAFEYVSHTFTSFTYAQPIISAITNMKNDDIIRENKYVTEFVMEKVIAQHGQKIVDFENKIIELNGVIDHKKNELNLKEQQLQDKVQELHKKEQQLKEKDQQLHQINKNLQDQLKINQDQQLFINELMGSLSWRVTHPIRLLSQKLKRVKNYLYKKSDESEHINHKPMPWDKTLSNSLPISDKYILIIAELSIPQCKKYRVDQKVEMLEHLGYDVSVVSWNDYFEAKNRLQLASLVIFYRVPAFDLVLELFNEARRLNLTTLYDVDDLIFDKEELKKNKNNKKLDDKVQKEIYDGADLYRLALSNCDHAIASTRVLGQYMAKHINGKVFVLPNCIDEELLSFVDSNKHGVDKKSIKIVYGSGTSTHDEDFLEASNALLKILKRYPQVELVIHGILNLPKSFDAFEKQIKKIPIMSAREYYSALNSYDINIAPLEKSIFNDAKSNIKFLEASIFKLPTVASTAYEFQDVIENGKNGFVCENEDEWIRALESLILDDKLRESMGRNAFETVMKRYKIENVAQQHMKPILDKFLPSSKQKKSSQILMVNILFQPISFGGATIVVEELARYINSHNDKDITVFTGFWDSQNRNMNHHDIVRYESNGLPIIGVKFPQPMTKTLEYKNDKMKEQFIEVLKSTRPNLVHFHSIQQLSASLAQACIELNIPYVITLHDMWWLCEKQFMIMEDGNYCNQEKIDLDWCMTHCSTDKVFTKDRFGYLQDILNRAALLISPSKFQEEMYLLDYISNKNIAVNKNGILLPANNYKKSKNEKVIRFAYMGGKAIHKGYFWLKEIFEEIKESNYKLVLVDLNRKLGANSIEESEWDISGELEISSGYEYSQSGLDEFFKDIDVLLFPSQWRESFGLTVREALVRDVWVITTDAGGVVEDIVEGENGNIVDMDDKEKFKSLIIKFLKAPSFFAHYQNPHKSAIRNFEEQAEELAKYYEIVLSKDEKTD